TVDGPGPAAVAPRTGEHHRSAQGDRRARHRLGRRRQPRPGPAGHDRDGGGTEDREPMTPLSTVGRAVRSAVTVPVVAVRQANAGPVLIRMIAILAGIGAVLLASPGELLSTRLPAFIVVAGGSAVAVGFFPRSRWVGTFLLAVVGLWLVTTIGYEVDAGLARIGGLAACIYLTHAAAALAAVLPYDAVVPGRVLRRWAGRVATVLVA